MSDVEVIDISDIDDIDVHTSANQQHSSTWSCAACTYMNQSNNNVCEMCDHARCSKSDDIIDVTVNKPATHTITANSTTNADSQVHSTQQTTVSNTPIKNNTSPLKRKKSSDKDSSGKKGKPLTVKQAQKLQAQQHRLHTRLYNCQARGDMSLLEIKCIFDNKLSNDITHKIIDTLRSDTMKQLTDNVKLDSDQYTTILQQCNQQPFAWNTITNHGSALAYTIRLYYNDIDPLKLSEGKLQHSSVDKTDTVAQVLLLLTGPQFIDIIESQTDTTSNMATIIYNYIEHISDSSNSAPVTVLITGLYQMITSSASIRTRIGSCGDINTVLGHIWCLSNGRHKYRILDSIEDTIEYTVKLIRSFSRIPYKSDIDTGVLTGRTLAMKSNDSMKRVKATYTEQYICYLMQIPGLSEDRVTAIVTTYPTFQSLYDAYKNCTTDTLRKSLLADLRVSDRRIGVLSERVYQSVYSNNPQTAVL